MKSYNGEDMIGDDGYGSPYFSVDDLDNAYRQLLVKFEVAEKHIEILKGKYNRLRGLWFRTSNTVADAIDIKNRICEWTVDEDGIYHTGCGGAWFFDTGTRKENKALFCMYCGGRIKEVGK